MPGFGHRSSVSPIIMGTVELASIKFDLVYIRSEGDVPREQFLRGGGGYLGGNFEPSRILRKLRHEFFPRLENPLKILSSGANAIISKKFLKYVAK
jgi:hypothetical protein